MPTPVLKSMAEKYGVPLKKAEEYWDFGKKQAEEQGLQGDAIYKYAMAITKRRMGGKEEANGADFIYTAVKHVFERMTLMKANSTNNIELLAQVKAAENAASDFKGLTLQALNEALDKIEKEDLGKSNPNYLNMLRASISLKVSKKYQMELFYLVFRHLYNPDNFIKELRTLKDAPRFFLLYLLNDNTGTLRLLNDSKIEIPYNVFSMRSHRFLVFIDECLEALEDKRLPRDEWVVETILNAYYVRNGNDSGAIEEVYNFYKKFKVRVPDSFFTKVVDDLKDMAYDVSIPADIQRQVLTKYPDAASKINNLTSDARQFVENKIEWKEKKFLPKHLNADQLAIVRYMDLMKVDKIPVKELKSQFSFTPTIKDLVALNSGKALTRQDVIDFLPQDGKLSLKQLLDKCVFQRAAKWTGMQRLFNSGKGKQNLVVVFACPMDDLTSALDLVSNEELKIVEERLYKYMSSSNHPRSPTKLLVLGWVRYTVFGKVVWIDEVQSDLYKIIGPASGNLKGLTEHIAKDFIRTMRSKGFGKFYYPTMSIKRRFYGAEPPISMYEDLPKKLRFKKKPGKSIPQGIVTNTFSDIVDHDVWELAGVKKLN